MGWKFATTFQCGQLQQEMMLAKLDTISFMNYIRVVRALSTCILLLLILVVVCMCVFVCISVRA